VTGTIDDRRRSPPLLPDSIDPRRRFEESGGGRPLSTDPRRPPLSTDPRRAFPLGGFVPGRALEGASVFLADGGPRIVDILLVVGAAIGASPPSPPNDGITAGVASAGSYYSIKFVAIISSVASNAFY
jgi:hypothetical protein